MGARHWLRTRGPQATWPIAQAANGLANQDAKLHPQAEAGGHGDGVMLNHYALRKHPVIRPHVNSNQAIWHTRDHRIWRMLPTKLGWIIAFCSLPPVNPGAEYDPSHLIIIWPLRETVHASEQPPGLRVHPVVASFPMCGPSTVTSECLPCHNESPQFALGPGSSPGPRCAASGLEAAG